MRKTEKIPGTGTKKRAPRPAGKARVVLTPRSIAAMPTGAWAADPAPRGKGVLQVRKLARGAAFYYRYTGIDGTRVRLPIGVGLDLAEAREEAEKLSRRYQSGDHDLRAALDGDERERQRAKEAAQRAEKAAKVRAAATLEVLVAGYVANLRRAGKVSANEVERALHNHVRDAWPTLWKTPAADITTDNLLDVVARVANANKLREAAKLRSYLRAAYAAAIRARQDARGLAALRALKITHNPAAELVAVEGANNARDRALSVAELRAYWHRINAMPDPDGALLRFHLLTGGQRIDQLARLTVGDVDNDENVARLHDPKGRRKAPRIHDVPLTPAAREAMRAMGQELGPHLFTITHGETAAAYSTIQHRVRLICDAMRDAGELEKEPFTVGDLRRTVETRLSAIGVPPHELAQLQSHGLGGVQARHYNKYDYLAEKRAVLEKLQRLLDGEPGTVTEIKRQRAK